MIKISVIVPVYNVENYLSECIDSLLNQTLQDIELILVDDESSDNSPKICEDYAKKDSRVKVVHKKNGGLGLARNTGLKFISGEYVIMIDSDDMIKPSNALEMLYNVCKKDSLDACYFCFTRFDKNGEHFCNDGPSSYMVFDSPQKVKSFCLDMVGTSPEYPKDNRYEFSACKVLYSVKIIKDNKLSFVSERSYASEDIFWNVDFLCHSEKVAFLPKGFYYYRYNAQSISHSVNENKIKAIDDSALYMRQHLAKYFSANEMELSYKRFLLRTLRISLKSIIFTDNSIRKKLTMMNKCLAMDNYKDLFYSYPYKQLPLIPKVYYWLAKHKCVLPIYVLVKVASKNKL